MRLISSFLAVGVAVALAACTSVSVTKFDQQVRQPNTGQLDVHTARASVTRPFREIGLITVDDGEGGEWGTSNQQELIQTAIGRARQMGADAIILSMETNARAFGYGGMMNTARRRIVNALAIIYTDGR